MRHGRIQPWHAIVLAAIAALALLVLPRGEEGPSQTERVRDSLHVLRAAADSCRAEVDRESAALDAYAGRLDSLHARVRGLEDAGIGGVPADSYAIYLTEFDRYSDSVAEWTGRADSLRVRDGRCRDVARAHNRITDSLSRAIQPGS